MENIRITELMIQKNDLVPKGVKPGRYAVATNLVCAVESEKKEEKGMIVLNYEPEKWNQWYPFYSTINGFIDFASNRFGDLFVEFGTILTKLGGTSGDRLLKAKREFAELFECGGVEIGEKQLVPPESWLKYSKTQNIWTYYLVEFYSVTGVEQAEKLLSQNKIEQALIPLGKGKLEEFLKSGKVRGICVVDNTVALIAEDNVRKSIESSLVRV